MDVDKAKWNQISEQQRQTTLESFTRQPDYEKYDFLDIVRSDHGVYASAGPNFQYAIFGRDSIEVAEDLLEIDKELARTVIVELAKLQGVKTDDVTEEEPGKIHHEYRSASFHGEPVPDGSLQIMHRLQKMWGGEGSSTMLYYGSYDATPLFTRLVSRFIESYGSEILKETYVDRSGDTRTISEAAHSSVQWLMTKLAESPSGLLEYSHVNPEGMLNQVWKDSYNSYLFDDGAIANTSDGIASIELQGYAYDALMGAAKTIAVDFDEAEAWRLQAGKVQELTLSKLWMEEDHFFAQGLDRDMAGNERQINTLTSNAGLLLESNLLKDLPIEVSLPYVEGTVKMLCSEEFLTPVGVRCRAVRHANIPNGVGYHSSFAVWPKETSDIVKGFRNHDLNELADSIGTTIVSSVVDTGEFYELFYVSPDNQVLHNRQDLMDSLQARLIDEGGELPVPETGQAWTISAFVLHSLELARKTELSEISELEQILSSGVDELTDSKV